MARGAHSAGAWLPGASCTPAAIVVYPVWSTSALADEPMLSTCVRKLEPDGPWRGVPAEPVRRSLASQPLRGTRQSYL